MVHFQLWLPKLPGLHPPQRAADRRILISSSWLHKDLKRLNLERAGFENRGFCGWPFRIAIASKPCASAPSRKEPPLDKGIYDPGHSGVPPSCADVRGSRQKHVRWGSWACGSMGPSLSPCVICVRMRTLCNSSMAQNRSLNQILDKFIPTNVIRT